METIIDKEVELHGELIYIKYVPVTTALLWDENPKLHNIGAIIESIELYGFNDPPTYDEKLGALVEGNGRLTALHMMMNTMRPVPKRIATDDNGEWYVPINFGVNLETRQRAIAYAIDHNNLTMSGGDFTMHDIARLWSGNEYKELLKGLSDSGESTVTMDLTDIGALLNNSNDFGEGLSLEELTDAMSDGGNDNDNGEVAIFTVVVENINLEKDVFDAIEELLEYNPGWMARISRRQ